MPATVTKYIFIIALYLVLFLGSAFAIGATDEKLKSDKDRSKVDEASPIIIDADQINYENAEDAAIIEATGNVVVQKGSVEIKTQKLNYYRGSGVIEILGESEMLASEKEGQVRIFSQKSRVNEEMSYALMLNSTSLLQSTGAHAVSSRLIKEGQNLYVFENGSLSGCPLAEKFLNSQKHNRWGLRKTLPWSFQAKKIVYDTKDQKLKQIKSTLFFYRVPVFYFPTLEVQTGKKKKNKSGFLAPSLTQLRTDQVGLLAPFYLSISQSQDLTITPTLYVINDKTNPTTRRDHKFAAEHRHLLEGGYYTTYASTSNTITADKQTRILNSTKVDREWYAQSTGKFFNKKRNFLIDYNIARTSSASYMLRYENMMPNFLTSNVKVANVESGKYISLQTLQYQPIAMWTSARTLPKAIPEFKALKIFQHKKLGGELEFSNNTVNIDRQEGYSSKRFHNQLAYKTRKISNWGQVFNSSVIARADIYQHTYAPSATNSALTATTKSGTKRFNYRVNLDTSLPLISYTRVGTFMIEPRANFVYSPVNQNNSKIFNEDSGNSQITSYNLFLDNRSSGLDRIEEGMRANYGTKLSYGNKFIESAATFGQSVKIKGNQGIKASNDSMLSPGSGLYASGISDYVGNVELKTTTNDYTKTNIFTVDHQFRLQKNSFNGSYSAYRTFTNVALDFKYIGFNVIHNRIDAEASGGGANVKDVMYRATLKPTTKVNLFVSALRNLVPISTTKSPEGKQRWQAIESGVTYNGCCVFYTITASRQVLPFADNQQGWQFLFTLGFKGF